MTTSKIKIAILNNIIFFKIIGHGGADLAEQLKEAFDTTFVNHNDYFVDMSECNYIDSTFIGTLLNINLKTHDDKGHFIILNMQKEIYKVIYSMGLHKFLTIQDSTTFNKIKNLTELNKHNTDKEEILKNMIHAHEALINTSTENKEAFQDLLDFLRSQKPN